MFYLHKITDEATLPRGKRETVCCARIIGQSNGHHNMAHHDTASMAQVLDPPKAQQVRDHLNELLHSHEFAASKRAQEFLTLLVNRALAASLICSGNE